MGSRIGVGVSIALYLILTCATAVTKCPWNDETWYASPGWNLITKGHMGTSTLEPSSSTWRSVRLTGIDRHTYWAMPFHFLATAGWYKLFGYSLLSVRALSIIWGLIALLCWFFIVRELAGETSAASLAVFLLACDSVYVNRAADGRMDVMAFSLASGALAAYLALRTHKLGCAALAGSALATSALFTHPNGGVLAFLGLTLFAFAYDRDRLRFRHILITAIPLLIVLAAWSFYIRQAPSDFKAQLGGAAAERWTGLAHPWAALALEIKERYLVHYGFAAWARPSARIFGFLLAAYLVALVCAVSEKQFRTWPGRSILVSMTIIYFLYFTLLESYKNESYLVYIVPLLTVTFAVWVDWRWRCWSHRTSYRRLLVGSVCLFVGLQLLRDVRTIQLDTFHNSYLPVISFLNEHTSPSTTMFGPAELVWGLGMRESLIQDLWLGCRSGKTAKIIVTNENIRDGIQELAKTAPDVFACETNMLKNRYRVLYDHSGYKVYEQTSGSAD
jgi:4-amino-4-deoxy-L-arabinose transferase-like glycosyltransferase